MNDIVKDTLDKLRQCDDFHNRCDYLLEHSEITYLLEYIQKQDKEIERLNNQNKSLNEMYELTKKEYKRLNNIINEVREYCKNDDNFQIIDLYSQDIVDGIQRELLEILDKVEE